MTFKTYVHLLPSKTIHNSTSLIFRAESVNKSYTNYNISVDLGNVKEDRHESYKSRINM